MPADVLDCLEEELLVIDSVLDDVMVRPGIGIRFGKYPVCAVDEFLYKGPLFSWKCRIKQPFPCRLNNYFEAIILDKFL